MFAIITVQQFPPRESFKSLVSFESLYGIWFFFPCFISSTNALIQFPKESNDLLIFAPSIILIPQLFVLEALSDPARSIKESFPILMLEWIPSALSFSSTMIYKTAWDREDVSLAPVASCVQFLFPKKSNSITSSGLSTSISESPATVIPFSGSSLISRTSWEQTIKSHICSL